MQIKQWWRGSNAAPSSAPWRHLERLSRCARCKQQCPCPPCCPCLAYRSPHWALPRLHLTGKAGNIGGGAGRPGCGCVLGCPTLRSVGALLVAVYSSLPCASVVLTNDSHVSTPLHWKGLGFGGWALECGCVLGRGTLPWLGLGCPTVWLCLLMDLSVFCLLCLIIATKLMLTVWQWIQSHNSCRLNYITLLIIFSNNAATLSLLKLTSAQLSSIFV